MTRDQIYTPALKDEVLTTGPPPGNFFFYYIRKHLVGFWDEKVDILERPFSYPTG